MQSLDEWIFCRKFAQNLGSRVIMILGLLGLLILLTPLPEEFVPEQLIPAATAKATVIHDAGLLNRDLDSTNIIFLWTEGDRLKVITVMAINRETKKTGIATIPLIAYFPGEPARTTIQDIYQKEGKKGLVARLERYFGVPIQHQVEVEQRALEKLSDILGNFTVNGDTMNMAQAFYATSTNLRSDDQDVVRAIAGKLIRPDFWFKIPQLVWVMVREVRTDLDCKDIWRLFQEFQGTDVGGLRKIALMGREYAEQGKKYREVPIGEWNKILAKVTAQL